MTSSRLQLSSAFPEAYQAILKLHVTVEKAAAEAGLEQKLLELVKTRASQINGCAFCTDMHSRDALKHGEDQRRLLVLPVWKDTDLFTETERAALALTEAMTRLPEHQDVPDEVYEPAAKLFSERQLAVLGWAVAVINAFNRLGVTSRKPLPELPA